MIPDLSKLKLEMCEKCHNRGYYQLIVSGNQGAAEMFCVCVNGIKLRNLTNAFRLNDLKEFSKSVLPRIEKAHSQLHIPEEAGKELLSLKQEIQDVLEKIQKNVDAVS